MDGPARSRGGRRCWWPRSTAAARPAALAARRAACDGCISSCCVFSCGGSSCGVVCGGPQAVIFRGAEVDGLRPRLLLSNCWASGSERVGRGGCVCLQPKSLGDSDRLSTPFPSCKLLAIAGLTAVCCAQLRDILSGARALLVWPSTTLPSCSLTNLLRRTRLTPDRRRDHRPVMWEEPPLSGDAPGARVRATQPTASPIALPPRVLPPPVVRRVVIPSRGCAYPVLSITLAHSGRLIASTALRDTGTSRLTCTHTGIA